MTYTRTIDLEPEVITAVETLYKKFYYGEDVPDELWNRLEEVDDLVVMLNFERGRRNPRLRSTQTIATIIEQYSREHDK